MDKKETEKKEMDLLLVIVIQDNVYLSLIFYSFYESFIVTNALKHIHSEDH